jgi:hypothetical protein
MAHPAQKKKNFWISFSFATPSLVAVLFPRALSFTVECLNAMLARKNQNLCLEDEELEKTWRDLYAIVCNLWRCCPKRRGCLFRDASPLEARNFDGKLLFSWCFISLFVVFCGGLFNDLRPSRSAFHTSGWLRQRSTGSLCKSPLSTPSI